MKRNFLILDLDFELKKKIKNVAILWPLTVYTDRILRYVKILLQLCCATVVVQL